MPSILSTRSSIKALALWAILRADLVLAPFVWLAGQLLKTVRAAGVDRMPICKGALLRARVFPIRRHYYEPLFDGRDLLRPLGVDRALPGIDWNAEEQLLLLDRFSHAEELHDLPNTRVDAPVFHLGNGAFESGDAEYLYQFLRHFKPARMIEVGSGYSTLMARRAIERNREELPGYRCQHTCIEPYEMSWLEQCGATVLRKRVEQVDVSVFAELDDGDLLFIDSSHVIRPQGDVVFEYLEVLPSLRKGVFVHVHDIFSPRDYPREWLIEEVRFWNEQYLLEAFMTANREWKIVGALNYLHHQHFDALREKCPYLERNREPGSFYIQKIA